MPAISKRARVVRHGDRPNETVAISLDGRTSYYTPDDAKKIGAALGKAAKAIKSSTEFAGFQLGEDHRE